MQNPVGFTYNPESGRAELTDIWALLTNPVAVVAYPHILMGALLAGAAVIIGIAAWHLARQQHIEVMRASLRFGLFMALAAGIGTTITGDMQGKVMTDVQPMKMAAAEALWTRSPTRRSRSSPSEPETRSGRSSPSACPMCFLPRRR
jgi:cytochrome d ubiquinol oxidase subunit I